MTAPMTFEDAVRQIEDALAAERVREFYVTSGKLRDLRWIWRADRGVVRGQLRRIDRLSSSGELFYLRPSDAKDLVEFVAMARDNHARFTAREKAEAERAEREQREALHILAAAGLISEPPEVP